MCLRIGDACVFPGFVFRTSLGVQFSIEFGFRESDNPNNCNVKVEGLWTYFHRSMCCWFLFFLNRSIWSLSSRHCPWPLFLLWLNTTTTTKLDPTISDLATIPLLFLVRFEVVAILDWMLRQSRYLRRCDGLKFEVKRESATWGGGCIRMLAHAAMVVNSVSAK